MKAHKYNATTREQITAYNVLQLLWTGYKWLPATAAQGWRTHAEKEHIYTETVDAIIKQYQDRNQAPKLCGTYQEINEFYPLPQ